MNICPPVSYTHLYHLHVIEKEKDHRRDISSTYIREELEKGNVEKANQLLGLSLIHIFVPDYQLSLAIGKEGQNARLAARLTGFKIDIKSETQAREMGLFEQMGLQYGDTSSENYEEEQEEPESYQEYEENYQEDGSEQ